MTLTVFVAGAMGALGSRLCPLLLHAGHHVVGSTRHPERVQGLVTAGIEPAVFDVFEAADVETALMQSKPDVLIHFLTDLPKDLNPDAMIEGRLRNARIWSEGSRNLVRAAKKAGTRRVVAQSLGWLYAPGPLPHLEEDPLGTDDDDLKTVLGGVMALETAVLAAPPIEGIVLRYGLLYGPGTSSELAQGHCPLHVDSAAYAAFRATLNGPSGIYNVADNDEFISTEKAQRELDWHPML